MKDHPRSVDEIAEDYRSRREALLRALTEGEFTLPRTSPRPPYLGSDALPSLALSLIPLD